MDTNWNVDGRGTEPRFYQLDRNDPKVIRLRPRKAPIPTMDFGAGWYHGDAITEAQTVDSHRSL